MSLLEPTFHGYILSNEDALCVIEAALDQKLPLVQRRPLDRERPELIRLGNVFVFIEESSDIKRWTDGIAWSASRILGRFLIYRRLDRNALLSKDDKKKASRSGRRKGSKDAQYVGEVDVIKREQAYPPSLAPNDLHSHYDNIDPHHSENQDMYPNFILNGPTPPSSSGTTIPVAQDRGLMKKTLTLTIPPYESDSGLTKTIHLISYFSAFDVLAGNLIRPFQTELKNQVIAPTLWLAMRRSSLGGKLLSEGEANFYLDSKYQLQNMTPANGNDRRLLLVIHPESRGQSVHELPRRYSSVYSIDSLKSVPSSAPVSALSRAPFGAPLPAPMTAPLRSLLTTFPGNEHHFFPDSDYYTRKLPYEEPPKKRSRSLQTDAPDSHYSSTENLAPDEHSAQPPRQPYLVQNYVPSPLQHPNFGGGYRDFRPEVPISSPFSGTPVYDTSHYGPEMFRNVPPPMAHPVSHEHADSGYEPFLAPSVPPTLNNRAFGLQVSRQAPQLPFAFSNVPSYPHFPQQRWDTLPTASPLGVAAPRLEGHAEDVEHEHHEIYE
ncbi:hypothetical protein METBIDRAFT_12863 [Metschnikowia bicuspidata var. bicuspidata NRRL YB-4993]|uniref:Uncharacterized protein n=1 Tax=Metschnikowia bicuspidata var. bicuspidata NRRL YB-4993 TaxID=869754 RepID=A0A1A0H7E7_9ASCO|nr:hypothetical protein METBIDRAFT_12863 [Metschnikowia bicuspidata var. bicuspidata NRRL YB-4993]OBA19823.1 hypothetical protein METBIDRAFT_12863 [Metschnikowia bicuspidata var. bicuspidata NRRL YB-4993]